MGEIKKVLTKYGFDVKSTSDETIQQALKKYVEVGVPTNEPTGAFALEVLKRDLFGIKSEIVVSDKPIFIKKFNVVEKYEEAPEWFFDNFVVKYVSGFGETPYLFGVKTIVDTKEKIEETKDKNKFFLEDKYDEYRLIRSVDKESSDKIIQAAVSQKAIELVQNVDASFFFEKFSDRLNVAIFKDYKKELEKKEEMGL